MGKNIFLEVVMDNIVIPDAPVTAPVVETVPYVSPRPPVYGVYTRISFDAKTGEMVKDKHIKSKQTAFILHLLSPFLGFLFFPLFGMGDFYCGRIARGFLKIFTCGGFIIWALVDSFKVFRGKYETRGKCVLM
ncbi:MAG: TM2 domain-containing protein [Bacteroides sp.]|nr:TM2 domain-containing protein [Bacteroides sp.]